MSIQGILEGFNKAWDRVVKNPYLFIAFAVGAHDVWMTLNNWKVQERADVRNERMVDKVITIQNEKERLLGDKLRLQSELHQSEVRNLQLLLDNANRR